MAKYTIPEPRQCLSCGGKAYARKWVSSTTPGRDYGGDVVKVSWQCSQCGRRFESVEHLGSIMIEVDRLPEISYPITYRKVEEWLLQPIERACVGLSALVEQDFDWATEIEEPKLVRKCE